MPLINIEYDDNKVNDTEIEALSESIQEIVSKITHIKDVFVYGNSAKIKVSIAPIEIFIRISSSKVNDMDTLITEIKLELKKWKSNSKFSHPINLTIIPMNWKVEIGI